MLCRHMKEIKECPKCFLFEEEYKEIFLEEYGWHLERMAELDLWEDFEKDNKVPSETIR